MRLKGQASRQHGYVLITSLIFLMVLTLIGVLITKNTSMELKMSRNYIEKTASFEGSEASRMNVDNLLDAFVFARGWPTTQGGTVNPTDFGNFCSVASPCNWPCNFSGSPCTMYVLSPTSTVGSTLHAGGSNPAPQDLMSSNYSGANDASGTYAGTLQSFAPTVEYHYDSTGFGTYTAPNDINAVISIFRLGVYNNAGAGAAMTAGYEGTGKGAAGAGASILFYVKSEQMFGGLSATPLGSVAYTAADYRDTIRN